MPPTAPTLMDTYFFRGLSVTPFRAAYNKVGDVRGFTRKPFLCLTATAGKTIRTQIMKNLHMKNAVVVNLSPSKSNLKLCVLRLDRNEELEETFVSLIETLKSKGYEMKKKTLFTADTSLHVETFMKSFWKTSQTMNSMVCSPVKPPTQFRRRSYVLRRDSKMRLLVATCALGMGVDIPDVKLITHYGIPTEIESYVQEMGGVVGMVGHVMLCYITSPTTLLTVAKK